MVSQSSSPSDFVLLSQLQHWLFCPRQFALIHLERIWVENLYTAEGRVLHEKVDQGHGNRRDGVKTLRAVEISSQRHGLQGVADVVELRGGRPYPVEYKRGRPKAHRADEVQLCAQALCLEEMFETQIEEGALFYGKTRRRKLVPLDAELRALTLETADAIRSCVLQGETPAVVYDAKRCTHCSLLQQCHPQVLSKKRSAEAWLKSAIARDGAPD